MDSLGPASLRGWTPIRVSTAGEPLIDWAIVDEQFTEPFFEQTIERAMRRPFNRVFARRTTLAALDGERADEGVVPAGFIFHMSRCGSTLIAQMLAQLSSSIVLSEAQPFDALFGLRRRIAGLDDETLAGRLRAMLNAIVRPRAAGQRLFVKFHAWHVLELPLIARAFPQTPWAFVFRDPRAVLQSQMQTAGAEVVAGALDPTLLDIDPTALAQIPQDEYAARALAAFCKAALRNGGLGRSAFVDYAALPEIVPQALATFFGVTPSATEAERMREVTRLDTKGNRSDFQPRGEEQLPAGQERLAAQWLDALYLELRALALQ
jgi:hypothetical protein